MVSGTEPPADGRVHWGDLSVNMSRTSTSAAPVLSAWLGRSDFYEERVGCRLYEANRWYHRLLRGYYSFLVTAGSRVLEIGCGLGDLLAAIKPARAVGIDFSARTIALARARHP